MNDNVDILCFSETFVKKGDKSNIVITITTLFLISLKRQKTVDLFV